MHTSNRPPTSRSIRFGPIVAWILGWLSQTGLLMAVAGQAQAGDALATRPNIVFIFSDDHAYQAISAYGDSRRLLATPNIDRIAREGMRFDRCLVSNSICGPSRATVLTGTYSHINGFYNNVNVVFDGAQITFPKLLQQAGYQTAIVGKWHLGSDPTGFDFWQVLPKQGVYYDPPMVRNDENIRVTGYVTDIIGDVAIKWLEGRDRTRPFLLMCQNKAPHREWMPAIRHLNADGDRLYPEPPTLFDDYVGRGLAERDQDMTIAKTMNDRDLKLVRPRNLPERDYAVWDAYYGPRNAAFKSAKLEGADLVRWKYQRYMHDYLATLRAVDENVGRLLDYMDREGLSKNTIVVYASDQGFFLGEHGWFDKRWIFEESLRTPFVIRWPGVVLPGAVNDDLVSNLDFAETFLEAAGVAIPAVMQGRSLVPILKGQKPADWRTAFYYQYYEYPKPHHVRPHYGIVTERHKLVHFYGTGEDYSELFDLKSDPHELKSVYDDPAYSEVRGELTAELARQRKLLKVPDEIPPSWFGGPRRQ
jgi:arylsulfatase A-like enzyme